MRLLIAAGPAFVASFVEFVEASTIVLAVGTSRGWRGALWGVAAAIAALAALIAVLGTTIVTRIDEHVFELVVGTLVVFFGVRWLRKAILRYAGIVALHDEDLAYRTQLAELRQAGLPTARFDWAGFLTSAKATLLEGLEVAFLVITLGAASGHALTAATLGAAAALLAVLVIAAALRRPLTRVPENDLKAFVGTMLCTFGVYWFAEGLGVAWAGGAAALLYLFATFATLAWLATRLLRGLTRQPAPARAEPA